MSAITLERRRLRSEAAERQAVTLRTLKGAVKKARATKAKRLRRIATQCKKEQEKLQRDAQRARVQLRERIKRAKQKARDACTACKANATEKDLATIDKALGAVEAERKAIAELRARASRLKDPRGRAGGLRAQELRRESDDTVRSNITDPWHLEVFERVKHQIKPGPRLSRTEAFFKYLADHPESVWEAQQAAEERWLREAEEEQGRLEEDWRSKRQLAKLDDSELADFTQGLDRAQSFADAVPF